MTERAFPRYLYDLPEASAEEVKAFVTYLNELKAYPEGQISKYYFALLADMVFILNMSTFRYLRTTKFMLYQYWPEKVTELEDNHSGTLARET